MRTSAEIRVVVVGAGIIGLSIAWQLARRGALVTVLERGEIARESSWAAAGMLAPLAEAAEPGPFLDFGIASLREYPRFLAELRADAEHVPTLAGEGILRIAFSESMRRDLESVALAARTLGLNADLLTAAELSRREPSVTRTAVGALHTPEETNIDPRRLCSALAAAAQARGARIVTHAEVAKARFGASVEVCTMTEAVACDRLVVAAGAWTGHALALAGIDLPTRPRKGQVIRLRPPDSVSLGHTLYTDHIYVVPREGDVLVGATEEDAGYDRSVHDRATRHLRERAAGLVPALQNAALIDAWTGLRPAVSDGLPVLGFAPQNERVYIATGHLRNGVLLAPATAYGAAREILGEPASGWQEFRPGRLAKRTPVEAIPVVLSIAGSDPSGGAGIQADQRVIEAAGCAAVTVPTALTAQNTCGVAATFPVPLEQFRAQLDSLLADVRPSATKIGLLPSADHIRLVAETIRRHSLAGVVLDPVIGPTSGEAFLDDEGIKVLIQELLPLCRLITPNTPEAAALTGIEAHTAADMAAAATAIVALGAKACLVKGGHLAKHGPVVDVLVDGGAVAAELEQPRIETRHGHGTGCFLSSAIAARLGLGATLRESVATARSALSDALAHPIVIGGGRGYPGVRPLNDNRRAPLLAHSDRQRRLRGIYFVTDDRAGDPAAVRMTVQAALRGGVRIIQLRDKSLGTASLTALARSLRSDADSCGALLIVNDRVDIALAADADGVHLGPDDLSPGDARRILGPSRLIGISAGSRAELDEYGDLAAASYVGCGPVYGTRTKNDAGAAIGVERLTEMTAICGDLPIIAIGGITLSNLSAIRAAGVAGAAVVTAISAAPDPEGAAARLASLWGGAQ